MAFLPYNIISGITNFLKEKNLSIKIMLKQAQTLLLYCWNLMNIGLIR